MMALYVAVRDQLESRWPESKIAPSLERISGLMEYLGDPQRAYPVIHVTGTNGKTSTSRMIESLLRSFGLNTGLVTSPHLADMRERIRLNGEPISVERFLETYDDVVPFIDLVDKRSAESGGPAMSFFEVMTGLAMAAFADAPVDVAIVEVGMGGSWDATNVADGQVAVVMPVSMDHAEYLGDTLAEIAEEKAGIIKPGAIAVFANQPEEAVEPLVRRVVEVGASAVREGVEYGVLSRDVAVGGQLLALKGMAGEYTDIFLPLFGAHQAENAAAALAAVEAFFGGGSAPLNADTVRDGFAAVTSPARLEVMRRSPTIIVDAAHNPGGASALAEALTDSFAFSTLVGVIGVLQDKDARGILAALEPVLDAVVVTSSASHRALQADDLAELAHEIFGEDRVFVAPKIDEAIDTAVSLAEVQGLSAMAESGFPDTMPTGVGVVITGSVTTAGQARMLLGAEPA